MWYFCFFRERIPSISRKRYKSLVGIVPKHDWGRYRFLQVPCRGGERSLISVEIIDCGGDGEDWSSTEDCKGEEAKCAQVIAIDCHCLISNNNSNNHNNNILILTKMSPGVMKADWVLVLQGLSNNFYLHDIEWWTKWLFYFLWNWTPSPFFYSVSMPGEFPGCRTSLLDQTQISSKSKSVFFLKCKKSHI